MPGTPPLPLWAGRSMALLGIVLVAVNLRTAVAVISPIAEQIRGDIPLSLIGLGLIGALPPVAFALSGLFGAALARRVGLERLVALSVGVIIVGHLLRSTAVSYPLLLTGSVVTFAGIGVANILLPPLVGRYFPDRIGLLTAVYVAAMAIGTALPSSIVAPLADTAGWRVSLGIWAAVAVSGLLPWLVVLLEHRRRAAAEPDALAQPSAKAIERIVRSRTAWAIAVIFAVSSFNAYACFAWLPQLLRDRAGSSVVEAGALLALYSLVGLPSALVIPPLVARVRDVGWVVWAGAASLVIGLLGLLLLPGQLTVVWVALAGLGPLLFPTALVLINLRTRTADGSAGLSGFAQGVGYGFGALGPLVVGLLHDLSGGWTLPIALLLATSVPAVVAGFVLRRPAFVEDEIAR